MKEAVQKYLPESSPATDKGHMKRQRKNIRPTKKEENGKRAAAELNLKETAEDMHPRLEHDDSNQVFCFTLNIDPKDGTTYMDCTGKFPIRSLDGMVTIFILYDWSSNAILAEPIPDVKDVTIMRVFKEKLEYLSNRGFKPKFNILDNIASKAIVKFLKNEQKIGIQLVEPNNHRANAAERAIQTFKNHMIAGFCTFDSNFLLVLWNKTVRQGQDTLNMLRTAQTHPKISAYHALEGVHDFN